MSNLDDKFWYDKAVTIIMIIFGALFTWIGVEWKKLMKSSFDTKFDERQKPLKDKVDDLDERVRNLEMCQEVNERVAKATEKALYGKNL